MSAPDDKHAEGLRTPSLRRRVTLMVVALMTVMLVVLVIATVLVLRERLDDQLRQRLVERAGVADALVGEVDPRDLARRLEGQGVSVVLTTSDGEQYAEGSLAGAAGASPDASTGASGEGGDPDGRPGPPDGPGGALPGPPDAPGADPQVQQSGDLLSVSRSLDDGSTLVLVADAGDIADTIAQVRLTLLLAALVVLLLTVVAVPLVVRGALSPLGRITATARSITGGDRARRLRPTDSTTELGQTATAFDDMLDEIVGAEGRAVASEGRLRDFVSDAAHELRTPVAGIQASAEYLLREDPDRAERERSLVGLIRETRRAGRLVDDLLLMARIDRGLDLDRTRVGLHDLAADVVEVRRHLHPHVTFAVEGEQVHADGDHDRLLQVVANLVDNAVQAAGSHGEVRVRSGSTADVVWLEVRDDGPGVPPADRERIFDRLVRLDASRSGGGSGLGLSIARGVAASHGGTLVCLPAERGACFRLTLPRDRSWARDRA